MSIKETVRGLAYTVAKKCPPLRRTASGGKRPAGLSQ